MRDELFSKYQSLLQSYLRSVVQGPRAIQTFLGPELAHRLYSPSGPRSEDDKALVQIWKFWEGQPSPQATLLLLAAREERGTVEFWLKEELKFKSATSPAHSSRDAVTLVWNRKHTWRKTAQGWRLVGIESTIPPKPLTTVPQRRIVAR